LVTRLAGLVARLDGSACLVARLPQALLEPLDLGDTRQIGRAPRLLLLVRGLGGAAGRLGALEVLDRALLVGHSAADGGQPRLQERHLLSELVTLLLHATIVASALRQPRLELGHLVGGVRGLLLLWVGHSAPFRVSTRAASLPLCQVSSPAG